MEVTTYNYVTIRLGPGITMNLLYGSMIKYRISLLLELVGFVTGPDIIFTNRNTMSVLTRRLNILIDTGRAYKLGTFESWPIWCIRPKGIAQDDSKLEDIFVNLLKVVDELSFNRGIIFSTSQ